MIYAKVIADSIGPNGNRLTSFEVCFNRFVLAEVNTHRVFSRNSASSRAIPFRKQYERVMTDPALPVAWPAEQKGMQGGEPLPEETQHEVENIWRRASQEMAMDARALSRKGLHKSVVNRILEPWMWHTAIITATDWDGFWAQRCSPLAQPELRVAAEMMKEAYDASTPDEIAEGNWHLPYIDTDDAEYAVMWAAGTDLDVKTLLVQMSAARCARVSYLTQDGKRDIQTDLELYERLVSARPAHWSPLEHVATPWPENSYTVSGTFPALGGQQQEFKVIRPVVGNFLGWRQHRFEMESAF